MLIHAVTPILNVSDVPASVLWFERIGWKRSFAWNHGGMIEGGGLCNAHGPAGFAGVCAAWPGADAARVSGPSDGTAGSGGSGGEQVERRHAPSVFLCHDGQGARDPRPCTNADGDNFGGVWMSWWVDDVDAAHGRCLREGIEVICPPTDQPWGVREFLIRHPDGHYFRLSGHVAADDDGKGSSA